MTEQTARGNSGTPLNSPTARNAHLIALDSLRIDARLQARLGGNDPRHVRELVEHTNPEGWLPIKVAQFNGESWLTGGFHRVVAAKELGLTHLASEIRAVGDLDEARLEAFEDNKHHGKPPALEDRKEHARLLAKLHPGMSYREIGRRVGINDKTAKAAVEAKPRGEVAENPHSIGEDSPSAKDPLPALIARLENLIDGGEYDTSELERCAREHIERWDGEDRRITAENLAGCGEALLEAAKAYGVA